MTGSGPETSPLQKRQLGSRLEQIAGENLGQPIIYLWIEAVKDFLNDLPSWS